MELANIHYALFICKETTPGADQYDIISSSIEAPIVPLKEELLLVRKLQQKQKSASTDDDLLSKVHISNKERNSLVLNAENSEYTGVIFIKEYVALVACIEYQTSNGSPLRFETEDNLAGDRAEKVSELLAKHLLRRFLQTSARMLFVVHGNDFEKKDITPVLHCLQKTWSSRTVLETLNNIMNCETLHVELDDMNMPLDCIEEIESIFDRVENNREFGNDTLDQADLCLPVGGATFIEPGACIYSSVSPVNTKTIYRLLQIFGAWEELKKDGIVSMKKLIFLPSDSASGAGELWGSLVPHVLAVSAKRSQNFPNGIAVCKLILSANFDDVSSNGHIDPFGLIEMGRVIDRVGELLNQNNINNYLNQLVLCKFDPFEMIKLIQIIPNQMFKINFERRAVDNNLKTSVIQDTSSTKSIKAPIRESNIYNNYLRRLKRVGSGIFSTSNDDGPKRHSIIEDNLSMGENSSEKNQEIRYLWNRCLNLYCAVLHQSEYASKCLRKEDRHISESENVVNQIPHPQNTILIKTREFL